MDCFRLRQGFGGQDVASDPRKEGGYSFAFSRRVAPELCKKFPCPLQIRGRRECRMRAAPAVSCAMCTRSARMSRQGSGGNPTFPAQGRVWEQNDELNQRG